MFLSKNSFIIKFLKNLKKQKIHQVKNSTSFDRYPEIFFVTKKYFDDNFENKNIHILSFGCSTGEECFSLRKYFPNAKIIGVDINEENIIKCRANNTDKKISFYLSNKKNISKYAPYDIIFGMSVLCKWPDAESLENIGKLYSFSEFHNTLKILDKLLINNGLLVIYNSNFLFSETDIFKKLVLVMFINLIKTAKDYINLTKDVFL